MNALAVHDTAEVRELRDRVLSLPEEAREWLLLDLSLSLHPPAPSGTGLGKRLIERSAAIAAGTCQTYSLEECMAILEAEFGEIPE